MKLTDKMPVSEEDLVESTEIDMRERLKAARYLFSTAKLFFDKLNADPAIKADLWHKFNATERRLMKGGDEEWS